MGDGLVREKGEDAGPLKEDAAHRSQSSHLVLNPRPQTSLKGR